MPRRWGVWPGVLAAGAWVFQPNLFGHGHYATYDALLSCLWVGSILAFAVGGRHAEPTPIRHHRRRPRWGWAIAFGLLAGCAADTKLTGWLLPLPFLAWTLLYREPPRAHRPCWWGPGVALLVLYALNPPWWTEPLTGVERFFRSNLTRGRTIPIPVLFLGQVFQTPKDSLPWYNTLVWTLLVVPVGFLALALAGVVPGAEAGPERAVRVCWRWDTGRSCWCSAPCRTRRDTTASASSCRPSACWRWSRGWERRRWSVRARVGRAGARPWSPPRWPRGR